MYVTHRTLTELHLQNGSLLAADGTPFDIEGFGRFKHGFTLPGELYGAAMAEQVHQLLQCFEPWQPVVIVSAPYLMVPTASHVIARQLCSSLNELRFDDGFQPARLVQLHKATPGSPDYAASDPATRRRLLQGMELHIDAHFVRDAVVLVVDDISISGTAERTTCQFLESLLPKALVFMHAASVSSLDDEQCNIEAWINQQALPTLLSDVISDDQRGQFALNARVLRELLSTVDTERFAWFASIIPDALRQEMIDGAISNGQDYTARYPVNLASLRQPCVMPLSAS